MRLVHITDLHIHHKTPASWVKNYLEHSLANLHYVYQKAKELNATVIVSGDFFDKPTQPVEVVAPVLNIMRESGVHTYTCLGQHDVIGHRSSEYKDKSIAVLEAAGVLTVLNNGDGALLSDKIIVKGYSFNDPETENLLNGKEQYDSKLFSIGLVHASIGEEDTMYHKGIQKQKLVANDINLFGDIHPGFAVHEYANGIALNIGSFGRRSWNDRLHPSQYLIIDLPDEDPYDYTLTYCKMPEKNIDVFDLDYKDEIDEDLTDASDVIEKYNKIEIREDESIVKLVQRVGNENGLDKSAINLVVSLVGDK